MLPSLRLSFQGCLGNCGGLMSSKGSSFFRCSVEDLRREKTSFSGSGTSRRIRSHKKYQNSLTSSSLSLPGFGSQPAQSWGHKSLSTEPRPLSSGRSLRKWTCRSWRKSSFFFRTKPDLPATLEDFVRPGLFVTSSVGAVQLPPSVR